MKFVIGLLIGTLVVLALASARDFSWQPPKRSDFAAKAVATEAVTPTPDAETHSSVSAGSAGSTGSKAPIKSVTMEPLPAEPIPPKLPQPIVQSEAPKLAESVEVRSTEFDAAPDEPETEQAESTEPLALDQFSTNDGQTLETAVVWKPFHSEVSADGFARRLSTQLGYPFRALREGPAKYHVVFDYESQEQREMLRAQVEALTGFSQI